MENGGKALSIDVLQIFRVHFVHLAQKGNPCDEPTSLIRGSLGGRM